MEERTFHTLIREVCDELEIKLEKLSFGWILQLSKNGKVKHITGNRFDINPEAGGNIACDKYATYEVLKSQGVPVVEHTMLFNPVTRTKYIGNEGFYLAIVSEFLKHGCLVVKPNNGCEGIGVTLCRTLGEIEIAIQKLFKTHNSVSICPFYDIKTEYRTFYLKGQVLLIYGKIKPYVLGDGKSTIGELIEELDLPDKKVVRENLNEIDLTYVPINDEKIELSWKHNLSGGALPSVLEKSDLYNEIEKIACQAGNAMNMNFATIDVIQTVDNNFYVLEVNSGVCATIFVNLVEGGRDLIKGIYKEALEEMFR